MDLTEPETWRWIWMTAALVFAVGEIAIVGSFFLAPFALGAAAAAVLAFLGVDLGPQWLVFVILSGVLLAAMRPLAHRLDRQDSSVPGVGAGRQVGQRAKVIEAIDGPHDHGFVLLGSERWRAESVDGSPIAEGTPVLVTEVRGTRVIVEPLPTTP